MLGASTAHLRATEQARALPRANALPARAVSRGAATASGPPTRPAASLSHRTTAAAAGTRPPAPVTRATRETEPEPLRPLLSQALAAAALALAALTGTHPARADPPAAAAVEQPAAVPPTTQAGTIASFAASGLIFKDTVQVVALPDPAVPGAVVYVTEVKRSLVDKLTSSGGGFFAEPSAASVTCVARGGAPVRLAPGADVGGPEGRDIFSERKSLSLVAAKTLRVRRIVDRANGSVLYVSYSTRLSGSGSGGDPASTDGAGGGTGSARYRTSVCALPLAE